MSRIGLNKDTAWKYHSIIFGGSLVVSFIIIVFVLAAWGWRLNRGLSKMSPLATASLVGSGATGWGAAVGHFFNV